MTITTTAAHRLVMDARSEPQWLIEGFVGRTPALLYADPKVGKTHFAVNMMAALLDGEPTFLGQRANGPVSCLYVALDSNGQDEITERLEGLTARSAFITGELDQSEILKAVNSDGVRFVVLDNIARILRDVDDFNLPGSIAPLTKLVDKICDAGAAVLVVHHTSKPTKETAYSGRTQTGTYALMAYFRQLIEMTTSQVIVKSNAAERRRFSICAHPAGVHGVRYVRDHVAEVGGAGSRSTKVKEPSVLERRGAVITKAGATTKTVAIEAVMRSEPGAERGTIVRYVGQHADKWGLT